MPFSQYIFHFAALFYVLSWVASLFPHQRGCFLFLVMGLAANLFSVLIRYADSWPMLPLYQGPFFLPLCIGSLSFKTLLKERASRTLAITLICFLSLIAVFFPKDFYLPFIQSKIVFSHLFFLLGVMARACFFVAFIQAFFFLPQNYLLKKNGQNIEGSSVTKWIIWGFALLTLSMFSGELWSYLVWGSPVVWEDATIITTMATWFYYGCFLHLHLLKTWNLKKRSLFAAFGALMVFILNCYPEMGKFQVPNWLLL
jgi:hypothetical protein